MTEAASPTTRQLHDAYALAKECYAALGIDTDQALAMLGQISLSLHCSIHPQKKLQLIAELHFAPRNGG